MRSAPRSITIAVVAVISTLVPSIANAAYVQWVPCLDGSGRAQGFGNLQPASNRARLFPAAYDIAAGQSGARLELDVRADYLGEATCAELLDEGASDVMIALNALHVSETHTVRPSNWTCVEYADRPAWEQRELPGRGSQLRLAAQVDLGVLGLLPTFAVQFVFFLGALTLRYPGFYQPVTSLSHWSALFSPVGPFGQHRRYDMVRDGIYEINGTLTGTYGLELMSQITGGPVTMDVWWNMVVIVAAIVAAAAAGMLVHRSASTWKVLRVVMSYFLVPIVAISAYQLDHVLLPAYHLALAALLIVLVVIGLTWMWRTAPSNQLWVLFLDSSKRYRLVRTDNPDDPDDPEDDGGGGGGDGEEAPGRNRDIFAVIFFALQFGGGIAVGGFQFSPLSQVVGLAALELCLLVSMAVLRPLRRPLLSMFVWVEVARLGVVALTAVFLPELDVSLAARSRVAIAILAIHAAVLVFGCAVPAAVRLASLVYYLLWAPAEKPQIYGLSQLRRRHDAVNNLSSADMLSTALQSTPYSSRTHSLVSYQRHNPHSPSDASSISFYLDPDSSPDALYFQAVPQQYYYFRPFRPSATRHPGAAASSSSSTAHHSSGSSSSTSSPISELGTMTIPATATTTTTTTNTNTTTLLSRVTNGSGGGWEKKPQARSSDSTERSDRSAASTVSQTADMSLPLPPLAPQWSDYSFREADLYYGHARARGGDDDDGGYGPAAATGGGGEGGEGEGEFAGPPLFTVRRVASSIFSSITGRTLSSTSRSSERQGHKAGGTTKGFEVRRPPRPPGL
ncbi:uncharacterized protein B0T15DRAFT_481109 [Chaetomium strumarium]|uniref:TRP C-terminal domain-containing protein n=1 Tax=Chaetomium strumarium TaxID=1170767 RepID=A0AAJ0H058_9PEZI|nr:hypothetical protein B0T15DRAFT_481109 [Chaetomium strumarium]